MCNYYVPWKMVLSEHTDFVFLVRNGAHFLELINDIIFHVVEGGKFTHIQKRAFNKQKTESKYNSHITPLRRRVLTR